MKTYYNTNNEAGATLETSKKKAKKQHEKIFYFFVKHEGKSFTPCEILEKLYSKTKTPITSVRRTMTDLTEIGYLIKQGKDKMKLGYQGKMVHTWKLNNN